MMRDTYLATLDVGIAQNKGLGKLAILDDRCMFAEIFRSVLFVTGVFGQTLLYVV